MPRSEDDYAVAGKPMGDDDLSARAALVDVLARDARTLSAVLDGRGTNPALS